MEQIRSDGNLISETRLVGFRLVGHKILKLLYSPQKDFLVTHPEHLQKRCNMLGGYNLPDVEGEALTSSIE